MFAFASAAGQSDELDKLCTDAAIHTALASRLPRGTMLALNSEPASPYIGRAHDELLARGHHELALIFEITERDLLAHPHALLAKVAAMRRDGFSIALDDVGAEPDSLPLLDILMPDVIKLDLHLIQHKPSRDQTRTLAAILAHHERTGAVILAEGIENDDHLEQALALGARLGQGYKYVHTAEIQPWTLPVTTAPPPLVPGSPFDLVASGAPLRTARKQILIALSRHIENQALQTADPPMVLSALQQAQNFTTATRARYLGLAAVSPLVAIFGERLPADLGHGIRGVHLEPADTLRKEWTVVALGAQLAVALIAREWDDADNHLRSDGDRRFDFTVTYDRALVAAVARNLLDRMV